MIARNRNELWGRVLTDELARAGVRHLIVSPGSRSAPVVLAAAADDRFRIHVQMDERSAGFVALGAGKATGRPAAVVTTSGTAVANLLPAVVEAFQCESPLLLLTADRPSRLRGADANQTIDQVGIFGTYLRFFADLSAAEASEAALRHLRSVACRAVAAAKGDPAGPAHLNLCFDKPLEPIRVEGDLPADLAGGDTPASAGRPAGAPWTKVHLRRAEASEETSAALVGALGRAVRPLFVGGVVPRPWEVGPALRTAATAWQAPLLADALSGARFPSAVEAGPGDAPSAAGLEHGVTRPGGMGREVVGGYDIGLRADAVRERLRPDLVVRFGAAPTSTLLQGWLATLGGVPHFVVDGGGRWKDHAGTATEMFPVDPGPLLGALARAAPAPRTRDGAWAGVWSGVESSVRRALAATRLAEERAGREAGLFEGAVVAEVVDRVTAGELLFVSSSMPVRDLDTFVPHRDAALAVLGNRGASGIDGIVSTAAGASLATGRRVVAVIGDLALLHDANGLASLGLPGVRVALVVVNNDGGGIFHFLPVREHEPAFTPYFATPHGRDIAHLAAFHQLPFVRVDGRPVRARREKRGETVPLASSGSSDRLRGIDGVRRGLDRVLAMEGSAILEVRTDRDENRRRRAEVVEQLASAAAEALTRGDR